MTKGNRPPTGDGTPDEVEREDTGRIGRVAYVRLAREAGGATPAEGTPMTDDFMELFATKLAAKVNGAAAAPPKKFLGLDTGGWTRILAGWVVAMFIAGGAWWLSVRDGLAERPTFKQAGDIRDKAVDEHNGAAEAHPPIQKRLDSFEGEQKTIRESQVRQEQIDKTQTEVLKEIKEDVAQIRRRGR